MDFTNNLKIKYNTLTRQGKKTADYIRENPEKAIKMTAKMLGSASGTSAAAVVRLCYQLGYESLEHMKISIAKDLSNEDMTMPIDTIIEGGESMSELAKKLYGNLHSALQGTLEIIDYDCLKQAVVSMQKAQRIYLFGIGSSGLAASELCHKLNRIGKTCIFLQDGHTNLEYASIAGKKDVVICISYSGETKEVYMAAQWAHKNGTCVISITRNRTSSLSAVSTILLNIPEREKRVRIGAFASVTTQMFMTDLLYLGVVRNDLDKYESMLVDSSRIANQLRE